MKKLSIAFLSTLAVVFLLSFVYPVSDIVDTVTKQLALFSNENPSTTLYLHTDKNIYQPNENIWFKAYVLAGRIVDSKVIYVRLVDRNKRVVVKAQFPVYDIRAHGNLLIPETQRDGEYTLYAYTDRMINFNARDIFAMPVTIRNNRSNMLTAEASVADTTKLIRGGKVDVVVKIKDGNEYLKNISGRYQLLDGTQVLKTGKASTNSAGEAVLSFTYPPLADDHTLTLRASFRRDADFAEVSLNLRHEGNKTTIKVYPEGGHLIAGILNKMVVEATDVNHYPVVTDITLLNGTAALHHAKTNGQGLAVINFLPREGATYAFEIPATGKKTTRINFTEPIEQKGYNLSIGNLNNKTILNLKNKGEDEQTLLVLRSADQVLSTQQIIVPTGDSVKISLPLNSVNKTVLSAAVFNKYGALLAERIFLNKTTEDYRVTLKSDADSYGMLKKVNLSVNVTDAEGKPVSANLSVAVVEKNTINKSTNVNILDYYYFKVLKGNNIIPYMNSKSEADMDALLITKQWWNSDWNEVMNYTSKGLPRLLKCTDGVSGYILFNGLPAEQATKEFEFKNVSLYNDNELCIIPLTADHHFYISSQKLTMPKGLEWNFLNSGKFKTRYTVHFDDYDWHFEKIVTAANLLDMPQVFNTYAVNKPASIPKFSKVVQLKEVRIGAKETTMSDDFFGDQCPDYVCSFGGFDCTRHVPGMAGSELNRSPIIGAQYGVDGYLIEYRGCNDYRFKNISTPDMFIAKNYDLYPDTEPDFNTTMYWNANVNTTQDGKNALSFFTSLLPGDYTVTAQGIDNLTKKPVYGTTTFSVK